MLNQISIIFLFIISSFSCFSNTYYVDYTTGNDNWAGTSPQTAFKSISKINNLSISPGDSILFKRGEIWKGKRLFIENIAGAANLYTVYGAYGIGEKPIISSIVPHTHSWTNIGANLWQANNPPSEHPERLLINGNEKLRANIPSELDGVTYFWRYDITTNDLYLYSSINPENFIIEYTDDFPLILAESSYIVIMDLDLQGGWASMFLNDLSNNIIIQNMKIGKYASSGIVSNSNSTNPLDYPHNILIEGCDFDAYFAFDYSGASEYEDSFDRGVGDGIRAEALKNSEITNCIFKNWGHASFSLYGGELITVSDIKVHHNYMTSPDICYGGRINVDQATHCELYNNQVVNTSVQSQLNGQNNHYHHNIFKGTSDTPIIPGIIDAGVEVQNYEYADIKNNIFENNLFMDIEGPAFRISGNNEHAIHNNTFRNNIIYNCGTTQNNVSLTVEPNQFDTTYSNLFQNNLIYSANQTQTCDFRGNLYNVSDFNNLNGADGYQMDNNIAAVPLFEDLINEDYHLMNNSPCIDAGTSTLATLDYEGTTIPYLGSSPDIGIYEYQDVLSLSDLAPLFASLKENTTYLQWSVNNGLQNKGFEIQKSRNGSQWSEISWVKALPTSKVLKKYQYIDHNPYKGLNYYRYKQVHMDQSYSFSNIVTITANSISISPFPNPSSGIFLIDIPSHMEATPAIIYNQSGQQILKTNIRNGLLDLSRLPKGMYWVVITINQQTIKSKLVIE